MWLAVVFSNSQSSSFKMFGGNFVDHLASTYSFIRLFVCSNTCACMSFHKTNLQGKLHLYAVPDSVTDSFLTFLIIAFLVPSDNQITSCHQMWAEEALLCSPFLNELNSTFQDPPDSMTAVTLNFDQSKKHFSMLRFLFLTFLSFSGCDLQSCAQK